MRILTLENKCFSLEDLPETIDDDVRFSVLDNSDPANPDFFFVPLIFLESFSAPAMVLNIVVFPIPQRPNSEIISHCSLIIKFTLFTLFFSLAVK